MPELLIETLTAKLDRVEELYKNLIEIESRFKKLEDKEKQNLPKFKEKFEEKLLSKYLKELQQSVKNPIRFRRKKALTELGIPGIEKVNVEIFDNEDIDETIQILREIQPYERLFKIVSTKISSWIIQNPINELNSQLKNIRNNIERLKKIEDIKSEEIKDYILQEFINGGLYIYQIDEFREAVLKIENVLNLSIKKSEIQLINLVYELINEIEEFGGIFEKERYLSLSEAKEKLEKIKEELKQKYEKIKDEINFWQRLYSEYVPETRNIHALKSELEDLKRKCKERYSSFHVLKQLYNQKLSNEIEDLEEFALILNEVVSYFPSIKIKNEADIDTVRKIYSQLLWLRKIEYPQIEELFKELTFENVKNFFEKVEEIKEEYERLKRDLSTYQRILGVEEAQIDSFSLLKQKVNRYKTDLQEKIGSGFEALIKFLKGETENIDVDVETLKSFIKTIKPLLREVLRI